MKVEVMSWNEACAKAEYLCCKHSMYEVDDAGEITSIYGAAGYSRIWGHVFEVSPSNIDGGTVKIDGYYIPLMFINSITESQPQDQMDDLEIMIRSLEVKLRCLRAYAEGKSQLDISDMINDILVAEGMEVFG